MSERDLIKEVRGAADLNQETPRCATCRHWKDPDPYRGIGVLGNCSATPMAWDASKWNEDGEHVMLPEYAATTAFVTDGSDYMADLWTRAEHGCTMHSQKALSAPKTDEV